MNRNEMTASPSRFNTIMALVDAWAEESSGWDCRDEAAIEVALILNDEEWAYMSNAQIAECGISAWQEAE